MQSLMMHHPNMAMLSECEQVMATNMEELTIVNYIVGPIQLQAGPMQVSTSYNALSMSVRGEVYKVQETTSYLFCVSLQYVCTVQPMSHSVTW